MKYGIITDIHCNIYALNEAIKKFDELNVDKIICCGDIIGIGPFPEETVQRVIEIKDKLICVRGNHEGYLLDGLPKIVHDGRILSENEINNHLWNHSQLSDSSKNFLKTLPNQILLEDGGKKILIVHYPMDDSMQYKDIIKVPNLEDCEKLFSNYDADIYLFGHSHFRSVLEDDERLYINTGSLGCPMGGDVGCCGLLKIDANKVEYDDIQLKYNIKDVVKEIEKVQFPMYQTIIDIFYGDKYISD